MGSQRHTADNMQLEFGMEGATWTAAALDAVQGIKAALRSSSNGVQPLDDAPNLQVLCASARNACSQAEASICSSSDQHAAAAALQSKDLECLCQLSTATLQLSSAVCCDPEVAMPLISAGTHAAALEELKGAVKSLVNLWASCMLLLQQHEQQGLAMHGAASGFGDSNSSSMQQAWQGLIPALATSVEHLLHMCVTSADFVSSGKPSSQQVPREMCTMSALNLSWANLTRLLVAIPGDVRMQVLGAHDLLRGLSCALQQLHAAVADLPTQARERQEVLVRFWLQSVSRLTSAAWEAAAQLALPPLLQVTLDVYSAVLQQQPEFATVQDILQALLQPRLLACLSSLLSSSSDPAALQAKLDMLLQHRAMPEGTSNNGHQQQQQQQLKAQVTLVLDVLQGAVPSWPVELVGVGCKHMVTWVLTTSGRDLLEHILAAPGTLAAADGQGSAQDGVASLDHAGMELLQGVLQGCLVGLVVCWGVLQDWQQQQMELLAAVNRLALSAHPMVGFLARELLCDLIAATGNRELADQQLALLLRLLGASAAAAAVPGAGWEVSTFAGTVAEALAMALQACDDTFAAEWIKQHMMSQLGSSSDSSGGSPWLDAGACALLVQECAVLQCLVSTRPQHMPASFEQLEEAWTQLWSTTQQVAELLEQPQHTSSSSSSAPTQRQADHLLVLHQLCWLFKAMQALLQLGCTLDASAAAELKQGAVAVALEVLQAVMPAPPAPNGSTQAAAAVAAGQFACSAAVLRLLAAPGQLCLEDNQVQGLLVSLRSLAEQHQGLHEVLAQVLGNLGVAAKAGDQAFQGLFQQLLCSPHWAVKHAAFESLLRLLRHGSLGTGIVKLLPPGMTSSPTEATPEVINTVKAHLHKQPDPQAQAAFVQQYPQLAAVHMQQLSRSQCHPHDSSSSTGQPMQSPANGIACLVAPEQLGARIQDLQEVLAAATAALGAAGALNGLASPGPAAAAGTGQMGTVDGDVAGPAQAVLQQAAAAARSLHAADQALSAAEAEVQLLLSASAAAARSRSLGAEGIVLISKQGSSLSGNLASLMSRLRAMQDGLATLRS